MFGNVNFRDYPYKMVTHARVFSLKPQMPFNKYRGLFVQVHLGFLKKKFSYNNMCSWEKIKNSFISLPTLNGHIAFDTMETFIKALEKLCIRSVIEWKDRIIETTKRVVSENAPSGE